jgi:RNA polymerase sigma-70 factor (ECF subfamily)
VPLVLLDMQGYSVAEIAVMLGIAEGTVKSRCARGRAKLAVILGHLRTGPAIQTRPVTPGNPRPAGDVGTSSTVRPAEQGGVA